jgi:hypothetical protein
VTSPTTHELHRELPEVLRAAMSERSTHRQIATHHGLSGPEFVFYERKAMFEAVNARRQAQGLPEVDVREIEACEDQALGHSDYDSKFALYCAELAHSRHPELRLAP